ncbi:MAG: acyl carrier protein [Paracoccaceae bacterium]
MLSALNDLIFGRGDTKRLNTVGLRGDLDDVELVIDVEKTFGVKLNDAEAQSVRTLGDLEALVRTKLTDVAFDPIWALLERIARDHSGSKNPIDRETTFFAQHARPREAQNG